MQVFELHPLDYDEIFTNGNTSLDGAFRNIHKNITTFLIWKIEKMQVVAVPKDQYGIFYTNDSYLIYAASLYGNPSGTETVNREIRNGSLEYHIHFWLGSSTTPDKSGVAAYKTVELDGHLGGITTQHRETQENESARFKSYFKNGFRVLKRELNDLPIHVQPRLYKIKGKKVPIIIQEDQVSWKFFNSGDVILVLTKHILFLWIGRASNSVEKQHAAKVALSLKDEYNIPAITFVDDGYEKTLQEDNKIEFNKYLPLESRVVFPPDCGDEAENEHEVKTQIRLYRCTEISGKYRVVEVKLGPLIQSDLNNDDVYIVDNGCNGIWVWVGKKVIEKERSEALRNARGFVKKKNYPNNTRVTRVVDGNEPVEFKMLFFSWSSKEEAKVASKTPSVVRVTKVAVSKFDAETLQERPVLAAESQLIDDGSGVVKVWKISKTNILELPKNQHGILFSGDCYLILYSYEVKALKSIIYLWLGSNAQQDDITCVSLKAVEINQELNGTSMQVRIVQGFEPPHFLQIFHGKMIIFRGKSPDYDVEFEKGCKTPTNYMLQINGSTTYSTKAVEVAHKAISLNSNYCYVFKKRKHYYIWCGSYSTGDQREMAKGYIGKDFSIQLEGKESPSFWEDLGGKSTYHTSKLLNDNENYRLPRLFQCSTANGQFKAEEIINFSQSDLMPEDIMLLDCHKSVFMWIGSLSFNEERKVAVETAKNYLNKDPAGRNINTAIALIKQGWEPPNFTGFFHNWDSSFWNNYKSFEEIRQEIDGKNTTINGIERRTNIEDNYFDQYIKYPIKTLSSTNDNLPSKVDPLRKEVHLTHDDFVSLFKMNYNEFETLPKWKQQEMKKKVGLF